MPRSSWLSRVPTVAMSAGPDVFLDPPSAAAALTEAGLLVVPLKAGHSTAADLSAQQASELRRSSARRSSVLYAAKKYLLAQAALAELRDALDQLPASVVVQPPPQVATAAPSLALVPVLPTSTPAQVAAQNLRIARRPHFLPSSTGANLL